METGVTLFLEEKFQRGLLSLCSYFEISILVNCVYEQFMEMIVHKYGNYECVYTDGSKCPVINSVSSAVFVACTGELYSWKLDPRHSVLGSELYAIQRAN